MSFSTQIIVYVSHSFLMKGSCFIHLLLPSTQVNAQLIVIFDEGNY